jgi:Kef-type K+ transport system membrane component KefB
VLEGTFEQIAAVLAVCVFAGVLATLLRQPLIVGLIAAGIAVGPQALGMVEASTEIELLAKIGISLLLFVVGLKLDVRLVRRRSGRWRWRPGSVRCCSPRRSGT